MSIKIKLLFITIGSILITTVLLSIFNIAGLNTLTQESKKNLLATKQDELKTLTHLTTTMLSVYHKKASKENLESIAKEKLNDQMDSLIAILNFTYEDNKNIMSDKELQHVLKDIVKSVRYGEKGYFWINDLTPKMIMHPIKPRLDGKDLSTLKDPNGKYLFNEMVKTVKENNSGFVNYQWAKPDFEEPQDKISYVVLFKPYGWIIGTGEYLSSITEQIQHEAKDAIRNLRYGKEIMAILLLVI